MGKFAGALGVLALSLAGGILFVGNLIALVAPTHGPDWLAAAVIAWVVLFLALLGTFALACEHAIAGRR